MTAMHLRWARKLGSVAVLSKTVSRSMNFTISGIVLIHPSPVRAKLYSIADAQIVAPKRSARTDATVEVRLTARSPCRIPYWHRIQSEFSTFLWILESDRSDQFDCFTVFRSFWSFSSFSLFYSALIVLITFDLFDCFTVLPLFWSFRSIWLFDSALIFVNAWMSGCRLAICKQPAKLQWSHPWPPLNQLQRMSGRQGQPPHKILHLSNLSLWYHTPSKWQMKYKWMQMMLLCYYYALSCHISELAALVGIVNAGKHSKRASGCLTISCLAMIRMCLQPKTDQPFSLKTLQYIVLRSINHWHP